jgi:hypothetical protein
MKDTITNTMQDTMVTEERVGIALADEVGNIPPDS